MPCDLFDDILWQAGHNQALARLCTGVEIQTVSGNVIYLATIWAIPVIIAVTFHEAAHGFVAHRMAARACKL